MNEINFHAYFYYDETSPSGLRWKQTCSSKAKKHNTAGYNAKDDGYIVRLKGVTYSVKRLVYHLFHSDFPVKEDGRRLTIKPIYSEKSPYLIENMLVVHPHKSEEAPKSFYDYFYYDETSPTGLRWKVSVGRRMKARDVAGCFNTVTGRYDVRLNNRGYAVSRVIYHLFNPEFNVRMEKGALCIDHKDGNPLNNSIGNLRAVPHEVNNRNVKKSTKNTSGKVGVRVEIKNDGKRIERRMAVAYVSGLDGKRIRKRFSFSKYGEEEALRLAHEFRDKHLALLNEQGAGYTERHGT